MRRRYQLSKTESDIKNPKESNSLRGSRVIETKKNNNPLSISVKLTTTEEVETVEPEEENPKEEKTMRKSRTQRRFERPREPAKEEEQPEEEEEKKPKEEKEMKKSKTYRRFGRPNEPAKEEEKPKEKDEEKEENDKPEEGRKFYRTSKVRVYKDNELPNKDKQVSQRFKDKLEDIVKKYEQPEEKEKNPPKGVLRKNRRPKEDDNEEEEEKKPKEDENEKDDKQPVKEKFEDILKKYEPKRRVRKPRKRTIEDPDEEEKPNEEKNEEKTNEEEKETYVKEKMEEIHPDEEEDKLKEKKSEEKPIEEEKPQKEERPKSRKRPRDQLRDMIYDKVKNYNPEEKEKQLPERNVRAPKQSTEEKKKPKEAEEKEKEEKFVPKTNPEDVTSFSNFDELKIQHVDMEVSIDFDKRQMLGKVTYEFALQKDELPDQIVLDLKGPNINSIDYVNEDLETISLPYEIDNKNQYAKSLGTPLIINLKNMKKDFPEEIDDIKNNKKINILIDFVAKDKNCNAIQFLTKDQTETKKYPFMFTQCEAIQCRSLFPCQDSPSVKATYRVKTIVDFPLIFLFGGLIKTKYFDSTLNKNVLIFEQNIPIPSYLVAFVAGELEYGRISQRCGVWTEKPLVEKALEEFKFTEKYIKSVEKYLDHPYEWGGIYNILVLPFSFPYGGMENPNLTFITPAILAGDKSLVNVIGHEISHSWTGNLVTNKNWGNFWINEGFTKFLERKIEKDLQGEEMANLEAIIGNKDLENAIKLFGENDPYTCLSPDYTGADPDDGFSTIPYEKGFQFLTFLERKVGEENFRKILHDYIEENYLKSVDYTAFKNTFEKWLNVNMKKKNAKNIIDSVDWDKWLYEKGYPSNKVEFKSKYVEEIEKLVDEILNKREDKDEARDKFNSWHTFAKLVFLTKLKENKDIIDEDLLKNIKEELQLPGNNNDDVKYSWYALCMNLKKKDEVNEVKEFLKTHGRLKYVRPLYKAWIKFDYNNAKKFFDQNKGIYHPFARRIIQEFFDNKK